MNLRDEASRRPDPVVGESPLSEAEVAGLREAISRAVRQVCPRWLASREEDLVQAALLKVVQIAARKEGKADFSAFYLRRAAHSALVDEIRRHRRRDEVAMDVGKNDKETPRPRPLSDPAPDPESAASGRQLGEAIRHCLTELIRPRKLAVALHLHGHGVPDIAKRLGWARKRAENLVYRGLADLRTCLTQRGWTP